MKESFKDWKDLLLGIAIIVVFGYLGWNAIFFFVDRLKEADAKVSATIIGGMFTVFTAIAAVLVTQRQIKIREIQEAHRDKKIEIYQGFLEFLSRMLAAEDKKVSMKKPSEQELVDFMFKFKRDIALWGSPSVLLAQAEFEKASESDYSLMFSAVDQLYRAFREDIGMSNKGLPDLHFVKAFLSDPNELDVIIENEQSKNE